MRYAYGGTTSDYTAFDDGRGYEKRVGGVILDVRRFDTKAGVTDFALPANWDGVSFPAGRIVSDRDGDVRFLGPDGLTARLEVRTTATANRPAGDWWILGGQPPPVVDGEAVAALQSTLMGYVDQRIADAAFGQVDTSGFATPAQVQSSIDRAVAALPPTPSITGLITETDARSIADAVVVDRLATFEPPTDVDLSAYVLKVDFEALRSAHAALIMRVEALENGSSSTDPPADAYSDTYSDAY